MNKRLTSLSYVLLGCSLVLTAVGCNASDDGDAAAATPPPAASCTITSPLVASASQNSSFNLMPSTLDVTIAPGRTKTIDVFVAPLTEDATDEQVTIGVSDMPDGLTADPVTVTVGNTAHLKLKAARNLAAVCFTGQEGVLSAQVPITLGGSSIKSYSSVQLAMNVQLDNPLFKPRTTDLPVLDIQTTAAAPVVSKDDYVSGTMTITDSANPAFNYSGTLNIKGHGNSTWGMPKKPYRLKLDAKSSMLDMLPSKNWVLLANYADKSMLRTDLAFHLSTLFGMTWTPSARFVEVYLNGEYEGTYQLAEKVEVDKNRVNIAELGDDDNSGEAVTGGYLGEIDAHNGETYMMQSFSGLPIGLVNPDPPTAAQGAYFSDQVNSAEQILLGDYYTDPDAGWATRFDQDSLINWFLVEELMGNGDAAFGSSVYFYKPRSDARFYMGPVWDFDVSSGNINYQEIQDPTVPWISTHANWYARLLTDPAFLAAVKARWTAMRPALTDLSPYLDGRVTLLTQAARNNFARWPVLGVKVWPNTEAAGSFTGEVSFLKSWLTQRLAYMDSQYLQQ